jgi:hypothetical protein
MEQKQTPREDEMYCWSCGSIIKKEAELCVHCGVRVKTGLPSRLIKGRSIMPVVGGILGIIAGVTPLIVGIVLISVGATGDDWPDHRSADWLQIGFGIGALAIAIVTMVGSSFAIARRHFVLAMVGGVCAMFSMWIFGIPALILIALSGKEFESVE